MRSLVPVDQERRVLFAVFMLFCCFEVAFALLLMALSERLLEDISLWSILGANLAASVVMLGMLFHRHHRVPRELLTVGE